MVNMALILIFISQFFFIFSTEAITSFHTSAPGTAWKSVTFYGVLLFWYKCRHFCLWRFGLFEGVLKHQLICFSKTVKPPVKIKSVTINVLLAWENTLINTTIFYSFQYRNLFHYCVFLLVYAGWVFDCSSTLIWALHFSYLATWLITGAKLVGPYSWTVFRLWW